MPKGILDDMPERIPLYTKISEALVTSEFDKQQFKFLPDGVIDILFTPTDLVLEFKQGEYTKESLSEAIKLAKSICDNEFKKVCAIVIMIGLTGHDLRDAIQQLHDHKISDSILPINQNDFFRKGIIPSSPENRANINTDSVNNLDDDKVIAGKNIHELLDIFNETPEKQDSKKVWTEPRAFNFCQKQWIFLSPVFSTEKFIHSYDQWCLMPFTKKYSECDSGTFGQVTKYDIHKSHLVGPRGSEFRCPKSVAVKEITVKNPEDRQNIINTWGKEAKALQKMNSLKQPHIVWFYTAFQRGIPGSQDHYLMLEWANGGNLRNFWKSFKRPALTGELVRATVNQLLGLVQAISKAHYPETGPNFRHGDLKPENILWFKDAGNQGIGIFKIGDWGLAKQHFRVTEMRTHGTTTKWGTRRYEPPEEAYGQGVDLQASDQSGKRRSRLYDIWALGCITIEFLIWLMYGIDELNRFNKSLEVARSEDSRFYLIKRGKNGRLEAKVHDVAVEWMNHMAKDPICVPGITALGNLLELVETRLLVVKLPKRLGTFMKVPQDPASGVSIVNDSSSLARDAAIGNPSGPHNLPTIVIDIPEPIESIPKRNLLNLGSRASRRERVRADELLDQMIIISGEDEEQSYWFTDVPKPPRGPNVDNIRQRLEYLPMGSLSLGGTERIDLLRNAGSDRRDNQHISDKWDVVLDNDFANQVLSSIEAKSLTLHDIPVSSKLCSSCLELRGRIWEPFFDITYCSQSLEDNSLTCDLCSLIWRVYRKQSTSIDLEVTLVRDGSSIKLNGEDPVLSIFRRAGPDSGTNQDIQIGYPSLADADGEVYFEILRHWLEHCDHNHQDSTCRPAPLVSETNSVSGTGLHRNPPTRVIDVGKKGDDTVCLRVTHPIGDMEWIALSHQWGTGEMFCTTTKNLGHHMKGMDFGTLPETFKHAVIVTRALGHRYLWIDSLCIVQGDDGDFSQEAKRMEQVYKGAYCVLASSRSPGHYAGFLQARKTRKTVALKQEGGSTPFYICEIIDDFNRHVLEGSLNKRGWVLQEHALARRTIYFTDSQTYFECGDGVRCETMTKMKNEIATFLGDPNFPELIMRASRGEIILRYQELYRKYSRLGLSNIWDRTMAIDGLQTEILNALNAKGGYGIFDKAEDGGGFLGRSLLWRRDQDTQEMSLIPFPKHHAIAKVPSWSWMAYAGGIDYISPPFGAIDWETITSPWSSNKSNSVNSAHTDIQAEDIALVADARRYDVCTAICDGNGEIVLDNPGRSLGSATKCVVLGVKRGIAELKTKDKTHYILIVRATNGLDRNGLRIYERIGAGYLPGKCLRPERYKISIH